MRSFFFALPLAVLLLGCGSAPTTETSQTGGSTPASEKAFRVALVTPGSISDAGWSAMAYEGLKGIESEMKAEISNQEASGAQIKDALRSYAQDGYQLVFGHGFEYNAPAFEIAKDFPNTVFVSSSGGQTSKNVGAFRFYLEQGFYLAGVMAAEMSKSGTIATVGLGGIPSIDSTLKAFAAGAKSVKPDIKVITIELEDDKDIAAAKRATLSALDQGADFVIHQANAAAQGVFDACKEKNVYAFGANLDQNDNASGVVIASAVIVAKPAFLELAKRVKEGTYEGGIELMGMSAGAIDFVVNPALSSKVPAEVSAKIETLKNDINEGTLVVPKDEF